MNVLKKMKAASSRMHLAASASVAAVILLATANANAAIDASVGTAFTAIQTDATSLLGIVTPIVVTVLGMFIVLKLIKKFGGKI
jgi:hypothetical protein